ncbi:snapalysin family zinc-dependent metalloprotease [Streptomyces sp. MZ04]|uniref:snapalysin family zinc-dependent metalloprotease n=1 Tax=Streptomyces sp. MZ04 TaxID=2559236 RepID=UPI001ADFE895|nr:snapalysin family zinc-dependent metalloprotease [Streptomyces sp. MZ04]
MKTLLVAFGLTPLACLAFTQNSVFASQDDSGTGVRVITYDTRGAAEYRAAIDQGAKEWNASVKSIRLEPGTPADITAHADSGWPHAEPSGLGTGRFVMGEQAVDDGHDATRIAAHELGHILGLPDNRTGRCEDLMSGASAGTGCTSSRPSDAEATTVDAKFSAG